MPHPPAFQSGSGGPSPCQPQSGATFVNTWAQYNGTANGTNNNQVSASSQNANQASGYDVAGDVTNDGVNQYLYDAEGRICAVLSNPVPSMTVMTGYVYNADGERVAKGTISSWSCDPSTNGFQTISDFVLGPGGEQMTEMGMDSNGSLAWQHTNVFAAGQLIGGWRTLRFHLTFPLNWVPYPSRVLGRVGGALGQGCATRPRLHAVIAPDTWTDFLEENRLGSCGCGLHHFGKCFSRAETLRAAAVLRCGCNPEWAGAVHRDTYGT